MNERSSTVGEVVPCISNLCVNFSMIFVKTLSKVISDGSNEIWNISPFAMKQRYNFEFVFIICDKNYDC